MNYSITQNGKPLSRDKYIIDEKTKTFSSSENELVLDFGGEYGYTFKTGWYCTFKTGEDCTFDTGWDCTFNTGWYCTFKTGEDCTFNTGGNCTFKTGGYCVVVRRDVYGVIEIPEGNAIKLNGYGVKGFTYVKENKSVKSN